MCLKYYVYVCSIFSIVIDKYVRVFTVFRHNSVPFYRIYFL